MANNTALKDCTCKSDAEIGLCETPCSRDSQSRHGASKERNPLAVNLEILGSLVRFAYANGYHELGYDVLAETVAQLRGEVETSAPDEVRMWLCSAPDCLRYNRLEQTECIVCGQPRRAQKAPATRELSTVELLNERDRINAQLAHRVLGDPRQSVSIGPAQKTSVPLCDPKCFDYPRCECGRRAP